MGCPDYRQYSYNGPVEEFGKCVAYRWRATTYATSEKKARCNLAYQYKKETGKIPSAKIVLPGEITVVE